MRFFDRKAALSLEPSPVVNREKLSTCSPGWRSKLFPPCWGRLKWTSAPRVRVERGKIGRHVGNSRYVTLTVLIIGPILALLVAVTSQDWADPDWNVFAAVCFLGWIAGIIAGAVYCLYWAVCSARRTS